MNATDRTPLDDPLMAQVRSTLDAVDAADAAHPSLTPPWARIQAGMTRARKHRRRVRAARAGAGMLALITVGAGTVTGVIPYPSFAPVMTVPGTGGKSALDNGRTRGSLAGDQAWLRSLREHIADEPTWQEPDGGRWAPPAARNISVLFAGDVGDHRIALVEGAWHWGPIGDRQQVWFYGPAGGDAGEMVQGANDVAGDVAGMSAYPHLWGAEATKRAAVVVLTARPVRVELLGSPVIGPDAEVGSAVRRLTGTDGVYQEEIASPGSYTLRIDGKVVDEFDIIRDDPDAGRGAAAPLVPLRGGAPESESGAPADLGAELRFVAQQPATAGRYRLLAAEPAYRDVGDLSVRAVVGEVVLPGGARVVGVGQVSDRPTNVKGLVDEDVPHGSTLDNAWLLPAGTEAGLAVAWQQPAQTAHPDPLVGSGRLTPALSGWTGALGPVGTRSVEWVHQGGRVTTSAAVHTLVVTGDVDVRTVRFLDAGGDRIGTADVREPHPAADPGGTGWVLPAVAAALAPEGP